ncbi:uncharacterized protein LOC125852521, partial [Solanum stenotomum]|uniref:uncharacterized protein LOC125852521 n=1 Tax=Solanum stenotomum TaxID=172797 RepID=UPI0020D1C298
MRVEACEQGGRQSHNVTTFRVDIAELRRDVDDLKSIYFSILFDTVDLPEVSSLEMPAISEIPPAPVTGDATLDNKGDESDTPDTYEEELGNREVVVYDDLEDLEGAMVQ